MTGIQYAKKHSRRRLKVGIVGTVVNDHIIHYGGGETRSLGGIYYTVMQMANLAPQAWEIWPVCRVGRDVAAEFVGELRQFANINCTGIFIEERENTRVTLVYDSAAERREYTTDPMPPLDVKALSIIEDADIVLVNFITGQDVALSDLRCFSAQSDALICMDLHSVTLGIAEDGLRYYRQPEAWQEYVSIPHVLQMNEREAACLADRTQLDSNELRHFGKQILGDRGEKPFVFNLTLDGRGSLVFWHGRHVHLKHVPALRVEVVDPTGCGDTYAVGFMRRFWETQDPHESAQFANLVAGLKCTIPGSKELSKLRVRLLEFSRTVSMDA